MIKWKDDNFGNIYSNLILDFGHNNKIKLSECEITTQTLFKNEIWVSVVDYLFLTNPVNGNIISKSVNSIQEAKDFYCKINKKILEKINNIICKEFEQ